MIIDEQACGLHPAADDQTCCVCDTPVERYVLLPADPNPADDDPVVLLAVCVGCAVLATRPDLEGADDA